MVEFFIVAVIIFIVVFFIGLYFFCKRLKKKDETKPEVKDNGTKFCKDCKFCKPDNNHAGINRIKYAKCTRALRTSKDDSYYLVSGIEPRKEYYSCSIERDFDCGKKAKFFEKIGSDCENRK